MKDLQAFQDAESAIFAAVLVAVCCWQWCTPVEDGLPDG
jgi:hypothetical protein